MKTLKERMVETVRNKLWNEFSISGQAFREEVIEEVAAGVIEEFKAFIAESE